MATATTTSTFHKDKLQIDILSLERSGDTAVLTARVTNNDDEDAKVYDLFSTSNRFGGQYSTPDGISLIDAANYKRHLPLVEQEEEKCLCSTWDDTSSLAPGEDFEFWAAFPAPPEDVSSVSISTPVTANISGVPVSDGGDIDSEITEADTKDPEILNLDAYQENLEGDSDREQSGEETSIHLSADVLFEVNESELTGKADDTLEDVAKEIDGSSATTIKIDGHADDTGDDSINVPLSEDRAESVKKRLEGLVTRDGVEFETAGHGSEDPIASNSTEEGREKNRRVTVTFQK
ncbi:OmpA family protein [Nocardiopsis sp. RSe5-2]|uniref:OmpA family protein n=1 Tax=Nocardiopsis endophytica TaxID=3018445 RepID=A0ABT4U3T8_9ACTN|nr:OmpA family protein [Nocardiopsis endophytica]MDA2811144.1 OmpA family protein [Nocardiopsis endophytica]